MEPYPLYQSHSSRWLWIVLIVAIVGGAFSIYFLILSPVVEQEQESAALIAGALTRAPDLGSELFEKSANPISGSLPETVASVPNPLEGIYQNPFGN